MSGSDSGTDASAEAYDDVESECVSVMLVYSAGTNNCDSWIPEIMSDMIPWSKDCALYV